jgi:hypothetical protein
LGKCCRFQTHQKPMGSAKVHFSVSARIAINAMDWRGYSFFTSKALAPS